ncbi:MAG: hypothetical protein IPL61_23345 [Myxococcales bacterium]|nr:hypothetical protein [Myxococcales bacterium]
MTDQPDPPARPDPPAQPDPPARPDPPERRDPPVSGRRLSLTMVGVTLVGFVLPAVAITMAYRSCLGTTVRGAVSIKGQAIDWRQRLGSCAAEADGRAITLTNGGDVLVRAAVDPIDGPRLELAPPGQPLVVLVPATCPAMRVELRAAGKRDDGSAILDGTMVANCLVPPGHPLAGAVVSVDGWWKHCKLPE